MSEETKNGGGRAWRKPKPSDRYPWTRFWWRDWMADADVRRLSPDQRGRFMDVFAMTQGTDTPGEIAEDDVRAWAGYSPKEWADVRATFARLFTIRRRKGGAVWIREQIVDDFQASLEVSRAHHTRAMKGVAGRRSRNDLATTGSTSGAPQVERQVVLDVHPDVQKSDVQSSEPDTRGKPEASEQSAGRSAQAALAHGGSDSCIRTSSSPFSVFIFDCIFFSESSTASNCFFQAA